ncbi:MAG TPA: DUF1328 domain-containing protein [Candidatus Paceibacterota bacterium]|nr:DUF1328 domain-containing protein [Candidatus Paceibacterota bacterium]
MLRWSIIFLVIAIIAALFGFTSIAGTAMGIAKVLFFVFLVLFVITLVAGSLAGRKIKDTLS